MRKGKYTSRGAASKSMALVLSLILLVGCVVGGTIAWLTDSTQEVKNTFTESDVDVTLTEEKPVDKTAKMIPGHVIDKDPKAKVETSSEDCFLFVKVVKAGGNVTVGEGNDAKTYTWDDFLTYEIAEGWTQLTKDKDGNAITDMIYYKEFDSDDAACTNKKDEAYSILKGDKVTVKDTVTKQMMNALTESTYPTLSFTAYGCQLMKDNTTEFTAAEAWANIRTAG